MTLTYEWQDYDGDYQKSLQDVILKDGTIVENVWPNAGFWMQCDNAKPIPIPHDQAAKVRLNKNWFPD